MAKKSDTKTVNSIICKDCINAIPNLNNLSFSDRQPILCSCKYYEFMQLYNHVRLDCINAKLKNKIIQK